MPASIAQTQLPLQQPYSVIDVRSPSEFAELLESHYDRTYRRSLDRCYPHIQQTFTLPDLSDASINRLILYLIVDRSFILHINY